MKYLSLDLETTSLVPDQDHVLMIGAVVEDTTNPRPLAELPYYSVILDHKEIKGEKFALHMNGWILNILANPSNQSRHVVNPPDSAWYGFDQFLTEHFGNEQINLAGKNVATFDLKFLPPYLQKRFFRRVIEPTMLFVDWTTDQKPPSLSECKKRAGISGAVAHDAYEDAIDVIRLLRTQYV